MDELITVLSGRKELSGWELYELSKRGVRLAFRKDGSIKSDIRENDSVERRVRIHTARDSGGGVVHGDSSLLVPSLDRSAVNAIVTELIEFAALQKDPHYNLFNPIGQSYAYPDIIDPAIRHNSNQGLVDMIKEFDGEVRSAVAAEPDVRLANLEVYLFHNTRRYMTSQMADLSQASTSVLIELTLAAERDGKKSEYTINLRARSLSQIDPCEIVRRYAEYARTLLTDDAPDNYAGAVIVTGDAVKDMMGNPDDGVSNSPLFYHLDGKNVFYGRSQFTAGQPVTKQQLKGDKLIVISDPLLAMATASTGFGSDGMPSRQIVLVSDGVVNSFFADNQYAQWAGLPATGPLGNIVIPPGNKSVDELVNEAAEMNRGKVLVIDAFSWFNPDNQSSRFSTEIRVGRMYDNGSWRPVKGGALSGKLFDAYADMHLSRELVSTENYYGPVAVRFNQLTVSGQ